MRLDAKFIVTVLYATVVLGLAFYALVIYDYALPELVQGAFIAWGTQAINAVFGALISSQTGSQQQKAFDAGVQTTPTVTATGGEPPSVTVTPPANDEDVPTPGPTVGG